MGAGLYRYLLVLFLFTLTVRAASGQPTWTFDPFGREKKPKEYEEKKLGSEKTADKKFTKFRRFTQNNITHYNYFFNANMKLRGVIDNAKAGQRDDYSELLSFYPFTLEATAAQKTELDSVIYKSTAGILLHDLRTDWVDNMYLLIGKAYYFRNELDSAALTFQFINYNLFPRKKNEDDNRIVGSNSDATSTKLSIANREKRNIIQKTFSLPPSRNDALVWLALTYVQSEMYGESAGLINILQEDPNLPKRLRDDLNQVTAYWYYRQEGYDSAAAYLEKALPSADNRTDKARWQFLIAQMYELSGQYDKADEFYDKAAKNTPDPLMDIYARLHSAKMLRKGGDEKELNNSIEALLKMARKDRFTSYRDIIYHSAAMLSLQKPDTSAAIGHLANSVKYNEGNSAYKNRAHLLLGKIAYNQKLYKKAADHYDSLDLSEKAIRADSAEAADRKGSLRKVATQLNIVEREDSLQMVAALPPAERDALIRKLVRQLRKQSGAAAETEGGESGPTLNSFSKPGGATMDLFVSPSKGEWYFYNASQKSRGYNEFKSRWGKRDNVDNWRRRSAINAMQQGPGGMDPLAPDNAAAPDNSAAGKPLENSYDDLLLDVPLTPEQMDSSNAHIADALFTLAEIFVDELRDYQQAIYTYEIYLQRFPDRLLDGQVYLGMIFCYTRLGDTERAAYYKRLLDEKFADSRSARLLNDPASVQPEKNNPQASARYQAVYDLFIQGDFEKAFEMKRAADSTYGENFWTPQLLYIESVYHIRCGSDSDAVLSLEKLISLHPQSPLKARSEQMLDVLRRRKEIEAYLSQLNVTRMEDDEKVILPETQQASAVKQVIGDPTVPKIQGIRPMPKIRDSIVQLPPDLLSGQFRWQSSEKHLVVMLFDKVDGVYINEARNAFKRFNTSSGMSSVGVVRDTLSAAEPALFFSVFETADEAMVYYEKLKKATVLYVSWLQASKYRFMIISEANLARLRKNRDLAGYRKLLDTQYPGKF